MKLLVWTKLVRGGMRLSSWRRPREPWPYALAVVVAWAIIGTSDPNFKGCPQALSPRVSTNTQLFHASLQLMACSCETLPTLLASSLTLHRAPCGMSGRQFETQCPWPRVSRLCRALRLAILPTPRAARRLQMAALEGGAAPTEADPIVYGCSRCRTPLFRHKHIMVRPSL